MKTAQSEAYHARGGGMQTKYLESHSFLGPPGRIVTERGAPPPRRRRRGATRAAARGVRPRGPRAIQLDTIASIARVPIQKTRRAGGFRRIDSSTMTPRLNLSTVARRTSPPIITRLMQ